MPKLNSTVKSVRIDDEKLAELEKRLGGKSINAWFNEQIDGFLDNSSVKREVNPVKSSVMEEIETMVGLSGMDAEDFWKEICRLLEDGVLEMSPSGVNPVSEPWAESLKETCHDLCVSVEKASEAACKALRKGLL